LRDRLDQRGVLDPRELMLVVEQLLEALEAAHRAGVVHRDIKPDNVYLIDDGSEVGFVKLLDFGVAKLQLAADATELTRAGAVMGTPHYLAPEQARAEQDIDRRADLFSLGVVMFEALTGSRPFTAANASDLLLKITLDDAPRIDSVRSDLDPLLADIVARALERHRTRRYQSAAQMQAEVSGWLDAFEVEPRVRPSAPAPRPESSTAHDELVKTIAHIEPVAPPPVRRRIALWVGLSALLLTTALWAYGARQAPGDDAVPAAASSMPPIPDVAPPASAPASSEEMAPEAPSAVAAPPLQPPVPRLKVSGEPARAYRKRL
jgi:serine/threonine-protein kinase